MMRRSLGFTLLELLVALAVFSTMAALAYGGLNSVVKTRTELVAQQQAFAQLVRAVSMLQRDLGEAAARPIRGNYGEPLPALAGDSATLEFTRTGYANPQAQQRSHLQRVVYRLDQATFQRGVYPALDRAPGTQVSYSDLGDGVKSIRFRYLDITNRWSDSWPPANFTRPDSLPRAVEFRLDTKDYGELTRIVELVSTPPLMAADAAPQPGAPIIPSKP